VNCGTGWPRLSPGNRMTYQHAIWGYAVAKQVSPDRLAGLSGVAGQPVRAVTGAGLAAAVSTVSLAEFGEQPLRERLEDLTWLEATARAHHQVIEALPTPVIPLRLATIYRDDGKVAGLLAERQADFAAALDQLTGRAEWGVKLFAAERTAAPAPADQPGAGPGASYLRRRRHQLSALDQARQADAALAREMHAELRGMAAAAQLRPAQAAELTGEDSKTMLLNATYLVDDAAAARFAAAVRELGARRGVRTELTGPWPAYSFAALSQGEDARGAVP
jgi:gas vesicle protein GvpL/GvpF